MGTFVSLPDQSRLVDAYERALAGEVAKIAETVPSDELAIQWDVSAELAIIEGVWTSVHTTEALLDQVGRMAAMVPDRVEIGFHLCYGSAPDPATGIGRHFVAPKTPTTSTSSRSGDLRLRAGTRLYLGLVHQDGLAGTQRRVDTAARHVTGFGVATKCGMGHHATFGDTRVAAAAP